MDLSNPRMPVLFVGHGSPMNALDDNIWSRSLRALAQELPRPAAILAISAHWVVAGIRVTASPSPETIHDFGGFPRELFDMRYPAPGSPELAGRIAGLLGAGADALRQDWGLDHGTWSVLHHLYPAADIPVVQLGLDQGLDPAGHLERAARLAALRHEGILVVASGNVTHNLGDAMMRASTGRLDVPAWAQRFDAAIARALVEGDAGALAEALGTEDGRKAHPSPEHFLPLLYAFAAAGAGQAGRWSRGAELQGAARSGEAAESASVQGGGGFRAPRFFIEGFDLGSLSMRSAIWD